MKKFQEYLDERSSLVICPKHDYQYGKRGICPYCRGSYPVCSSCGEKIELGDDVRSGNGPVLHKSCKDKPLTFINNLRKSESNS